jgi:uncharacterized protein (TIGR03435 family)
MLPVGIGGAIAWMALVAFAQEPPPAWTNIPLAVAIRMAYGIQPDQLIGGPSWIASDRWDIVGKTDRPATWDQHNKMLQTLLVDRFKLKVHWETRQLSQYGLAVAAGGPKLVAVREDSNARPSGTRIGRGLIDAHGIGIAQFVFWLRPRRRTPPNHQYLPRYESSG